MTFGDYFRVRQMLHNVHKLHEIAIFSHFWVIWALSGVDFDVQFVCRRWFGGWMAKSRFQKFQKLEKSS